METIKCFTTYNTDTDGSWGIGQKQFSSDLSLEEVLKEAIKIKAMVIVKPSYGNWWYVKGIKNAKTYKDIKLHIDKNLKENYKAKSRLWLIKYL